MAVFLIRGSNKKWCHLTDSMKFRGDLQLDVLISNDYVWTQTRNGLALFMERELTSVLMLGLQANVVHMR